MSSKLKSFFASKTVRFALGTFALALWPTVQHCMNEMRLPTEMEYIQMAGILMTTGGTMIGRYLASEDLYTPAFLPGRNQDS